MMHIVFNEADVEVLQKAIGLDSDLDGEVLLIRDDYAVGPLGEIYSAEGIAQRRNWWAEVLAGGDYEGLVAEGRVDDPAAVRGIRERLSENPEENCWIWVAQNKHDVCGYYWLISQLQDFQGRVYILFLNNLPFINEKGHLFYPQWLATYRRANF